MYGYQNKFLRILTYADLCNQIDALKQICRQKKAVFLSVYELLRIRPKPLSKPKTTEFINAHMH